MAVLLILVVLSFGPMDRAYLRGYWDCRLTHRHGPAIAEDPGYLGIDLYMADGEPRDIDGAFAYWHGWHFGGGCRGVPPTP
jgi:hypothetical protein